MLITWFGIGINKQKKNPELISGVSFYSNDYFYTTGPVQIIWIIFFCFIFICFLQQQLIKTVVSTLQQATETGCSLQTLPAAVFVLCCIEAGGLNINHDVSTHNQVQTLVSFRQCQMILDSQRCIF